MGSPPTSRESRSGSRSTEPRARDLVGHPLAQPGGSLHSAGIDHRPSRVTAAAPVTQQPGTAAPLATEAPIARNKYRYASRAGP